MDFAIGSKGYESYCGTSYASKLLGISIGPFKGWWREANCGLGELMADIVVFL